MEVTDMILDVEQLVTTHELPTVALRSQMLQTRVEVLCFVAAEHPPFLQYYESPRAGTDVYAVMSSEQMVGVVLIEKEPRAAVTPTDGAIACLVIAERLRGERLGSAAIVACCNQLRAYGFQRVIAEWVWSIELYGRLGFQVWKTREIGTE